MYQRRKTVSGALALAAAASVIASTPTAIAAPSHSGASPTSAIAQSSALTSGLSGTFAIKNKKTGRCADIPGFGPGRPDTPVNQYTCDFSTSDNQRWRFVPKGQTTGSSGV